MHPDEAANRDLRDYVVKVHFATDNPYAAQHIAAAVYEAYDDAYQEFSASVNAGSVLLVPNQSESEADAEADELQDLDIADFDRAGQNPNPLPMGFPIFDGDDPK